ncbi:hypothetical protein VTH06DRAFT_4611 [Thermothelomyces fergusii]
MDASQSSKQPYPRLGFFAGLGMGKPLVTEFAWLSQPSHHSGQSRKGALEIRIPMTVPATQYLVLIHTFSPDPA